MTAEAPETQSSSSSKIQIKLTFNNQTITFNTKSQKPLAKVFSTFAERLNIDESELRFHFNGDRIRAEQTPEELGIEEGDEIQTSVMQVGGGSERPILGW